MPGHFSFFTQNIQENEAVFDENETRHAIQALRYKVGDNIYFTDGLGNRYQGSIKHIEKQRFTASISEKIQVQGLPELTIAVGIIKHTDRLEWLVEKCTELGVKRLVFIQTDNTEKQSLNEERMRKVAIAALKQSQGSRLPLMETLPFATVLGEAHESRLICHCRNEITIATACKETLAGDCLVLIGPEGDFTSKEVQMAATAGFSDYPLGTLILRTETACMAIAGSYLLGMNHKPNK